MASKKRKRREKRSDESYLISARKLSPLVPGLKKYKRRKRITRYEKSAIARREKQLKNIPFLVPLTKKQARKVGRKKLFLPGVQAIQLRNVPEGAKIRFNKKGDIIVIANNQHWIYWSLDRETVRSRRGMRHAGRLAFEKKFPIEKVSDLTTAAFKKYQVQQVQLWAHAGIVGAPFHSINQFILWVNQKWNAGRYMSTQVRESGDIYDNPSDPGKWVNGIAILIENPEYTKRRRALEKEGKTG
ncbi:MAG: hypothetical protein KGJ13_06245 [Patescibacteria group bacterium]|nr:hypothetical protein [Patescibacteria group bacterium]